MCGEVPRIPGRACGPAGVQRHGPMSGPPRRKSVPPAPPPSLDDERPTPIATEAAPTTTTTLTQMELSPEPPTILAISITAPTFKSSDQVPAARLPPSFA